MIASRVVLRAAGACLLASAGCRSNDADARAGDSVQLAAPAPARAVETVPIDTLVVTAIGVRLDGARPASLSVHEWRHVRVLYDAKARVPLWLEGTGLRQRADWLVSALANAHTGAVRVDTYPFAELRAALAPLSTASPGAPPTSAQLAEADVLLTALYVAGVEDVLVGQINPASVSQDWHIATSEVGVDSVIATAIDAPSLDSALAYLRPHHADYVALLAELARYRGIVGSGGWKRQPAGPALALGDTSTVARLTALADRLRAEGYAADVVVTALEDTGAASAATARAPRAVYDATLAAAVAVFQSRHGMEADSAFGTGTRAALDVPADYRLRQIAANLERHRWLPRTLGDRYIFVNVPSFEFEAYDAGKLALTMRVIVGAEYRARATPNFSDSMSYVVFRPYWNVTPNIAASELWPKERKNPGYLARNGYEVVRDGGGTRIRQKPGPKNALGLAKFIFPNDFNIYLHDTPADDLFAKTVRAFSHGCIRVEKPDELAAFVLGPQGWDLDRVRAAMSQEPNDKRVELERKLPVYIVYFTTFVRDGQLHFGPDIYDRDEPLVRAVERAAVPDPRSVQAAEAVRQVVRELVASTVR